jgi:hypothetical protein
MLRHWNAEFWVVQNVHRSRGSIRTVAGKIMHGEEIRSTLGVSQVCSG